MAKAKENAASQRPAAGQPEQEPPAPVAPGQPRKPLGKYLFAHTDIPKEIQAFVAEKMGKGAEAHPARADGGYKGRVLLNSDKYLVQSVGRNTYTAVVHKKEGLEMVGSNIQWRDKNQRLGSVDVQIHYDGEKGKVYAWNRQRDDQQRMLNKAQTFAKTITNEKEREAFLSNLKTMLTQPQKDKDAKAVQTPERSQSREPQKRERAPAGPER